MRQRNKLIYISLISMTIRSGPLWAHDCGLIANELDISNPKTYTSFTNNFKESNIEWVVPAAAISQALVNLKKACCMSSVINKNEPFCKAFKQGKNYPDSIFLFDHLIDIGLRRLDGKQELVYGLSPDSKAADRRTFITQAAEDKDGTSAQIILDRRKTDRTRTQIYVDHRSAVQFKEIIEQYGQSTVADRYGSVCNIISIVSQGLNGGTINDTVLKKCKKLVDQRVANEQRYVQNIMMKKSNELLYNVRQAYSNEYFIQNRMMALMATLDTMRGLFGTFVQQAPASKSCSQ